MTYSISDFSSVNFTVNNEVVDIIKNDSKKHTFLAYVF